MIQKFILLSKLLKVLNNIKEMTTEMTTKMTTEIEYQQIIDSLVNGMVNDFWKDNDPIQLAHKMFNELVVIMSERPIQKEKVEKHAKVTGFLSASNKIFDQEVEKLIEAVRFYNNLTEHDIL